MAAGGSVYAVTAARRLLSRRAKGHAGKKIGLSNVIVARLARKIGRTTKDDKTFLGVYPADCIPAKFANRGRFAIIVNLGRWRREEERGVVGHFVAIVAEGDSVAYIDSFGQDCFQPDVRDFLRRCKRPIRHNNRQVQSFDSMACGFYALLYMLYFTGQHRFRLTFSKKNLRANDAKCVMYLHKIIDENYNRCT